VSWNAFSGLQHLTLTDTKLQCPMVVDENGQVRSQKQQPEKKKY